MLMRRLTVLAALGLTAITSALPAHAEEAENAASDSCGPTGCRYRVTPDQLLAKAEELVLAKNWDAARPLVKALGQIPEYRTQQRFLAGFIAMETGQTDEAISKFRQVLEEDPGQTRVRLELARAYLIKGKEGAADYHFRLAENDENLPPEIARTIRNTRSILRDHRVWRFSFDVGFAPDTNINGATDAETIDINFGPIKLPLTLNEDARQRSGIGQTGSISGGVRVKTSDTLAMLLDVDARGVNYNGTEADDFVAQIAAGPELRLGKYTSVSLQALGQQRWYGGDLIMREYGGRVNLQKALDEGQRVGVEIDARRSDSLLSPSYTGWQLGGNATYERIVGKAMIASVGVFGRRDFLNSDAFSSVNYGVNLGLGGELPLGINAGVSGSISRSQYDAPILLYSSEKREDWRSSARAYLGSRAVKVLGFSPSVNYTYTRVDSNYDLYQMDRHRVQFSLAKFF